jgi:integrase
MEPKGDRLPKHRPHASGQGIVTLSGRDCYTGKWGTPESEAKYNRLVADWLANGRRLPPSPDGLTMGRLAREFAAHCEGRYVKRGEPTSYSERVGRVMTELAGHAGDLPVAEFGPAALRAFRRTWTHPLPGSRRDRGVCRRVANGYHSVVIAMARWAVSMELVGPEWLVRLATVDSLKEGRDGVADPPEIAPVPDEIVEATLPRLPPAPRAMVQVQRLTGMRPGEACTIRPCDLDRSGDVWIYRVAPDWDKTSHTRRGRLVPIGPKAQAILQPWLDAQPDPDSYLFRPSKGKRAGRKANLPYLAKSYDRVIDYACRKAGVPAWNANQLRHSALTEIRAAHGLDAAQRVGGHSQAGMTERYAKADLGAAIDAARKSG